MANRNSKAFHALVLLFLLAMLMERADATLFRVGGTNGWTVQADSKALSLNQWAEMNRFQIGDTLLFVYLPDKDSVVQVKKDGYDKCNTAASLATFKDGNTSFKLNQSGHYYFISGIAENCNKNEKLVVVVMADRSNTKQTTSASPPSPTTTEITPSLAPGGQESTSPPPPPPNGNGASSSSKVVGVMGTSLGGGFLLGLCLLFAL